MRRRGNAKEKRDRAVREFHLEHPHYTHKEIGERFSLDHSYISKILKGEKPMKLKFRWETHKGRFGSGESLYINEICIGAYSWNAAGNRGTTNLWVGIVELPSLKESRIHDNDTNAIKQYMETIVTTWFEEALKD